MSCVRRFRPFDGLTGFEVACHIPSVHHSSAAVQEILDPIVYRVPEIAALLQIGRAAAYRLVQSQELPCVRIGRSVRVRRSDFDAYLARQRRSR